MVILVGPLEDQLMDVLAVVVVLVVLEIQDHQLV
jgi:hypothetical protein